MKTDRKNSTPHSGRTGMRVRKSHKRFGEELCFSIGGIFGSGHEVMLAGDRLRCRTVANDSGFGPWTVADASREDWGKFWSTLDEIGVWGWAPTYYDEGICDGTQWSLRLEHAGRKLHCAGSNAYPGAEGPEWSNVCAFGRFLAALRQLTGLDDLQ